MPSNGSDPSRAPDPSVARLDARLRSPRPMAHEWIVLAFTGAAVVLLERMPVTYPRSALVLSFLSFLAPLLLLAFLLAWFWHRRVRPDASWTPAREALVLGRLGLPLLVALSVHFVLKTFIYVINPRVWDRSLAAADRFLFFGLEPGRFLTALFSQPLLLHALDVLYSLAYFFIVAGSTLVLFALLPAPRKLAYVASYEVLWIAGAALYLVLPSWGPVYVFTSDYAGVLRHMPITVNVQRELFRELRALVDHPLAPRVARLGCVAAFPSLHIGEMTLITLATRWLSRRWFRIQVGLTAVMALAAIVTGYHYVVDVVAGVLLALASWWLGGRLMAFAGKPEKP